MLVEIKLQSLEETSGVSWSLIDTNCKSMINLQLSANRVYRKHCGLSLGHSYTLQCQGEQSEDGNGWMSNHLLIENSVYCEYAHKNELINITITGKVCYLQTI